MSLRGDISAIVLLTGWLWAATGASGQRAPGEISPEFFGLNAVSFFHYRDEPDAAARAERRMEAMKAAGARADRFDFWWGEMEPTRGQWKWDKADWLIDFYQRNRVEMLPILSYRAAWMKGPPHTEQDFADFANYTFQVVSRYKGRVRAWEVWNEPNIPTFWDPPSAKDYARLLAAAYDAAKRADPGCVVVGASANETDVNWLIDIAAAGALEHMDAYSFHPYSMADGPEEMHFAMQIENLRATLVKLGHAKMPLWITEMGWTADAAKGEEVAAQCRYLVQSHVMAAAEGVTKLYWFNLQDWMENGKLQGWGLLSPEGKAKGSLGVYRPMVEMLGGAKFRGYLPLEGGTGYVFDGHGKTVVVAWAHRGQKAELTLPARPAAVTDLAGKSMRAAGQITVGEDPVYVTFAKQTEFAGMVERLPRAANLVVNGSLAMLDHGEPYAWHKGVFYGGADQGTFAMGEGPRPGVRALSLAGTKDALWQSYPVPALPGQKFTVTAKVKGVAATGENAVQLLFLAGPGWGWKGGPQTRSVTGSTEWQTLSVTGTCPPDADVVRVNLLSKGNMGSVLFSDISLKLEE